jgi:hypothetical protein
MKSISIRKASDTGVETKRGRKTFTAEARSSQRPEYSSKYSSKILHLCALSVSAVLFPDASFIRGAKVGGHGTSSAPTR